MLLRVCSTQACGDVLGGGGRALLGGSAPVLSSACHGAWRCFLQGVSAAEMCLGPVWVGEGVLLGSQK